MKQLSTYLLTAIITFGLSGSLTADALAQDAGDTSSFTELLEQLKKEKEEKEKKNQDAMVEDFDFPVPPIKPYQSPMPWGVDSSIFLTSNSDGSVRHTMSKFTCPDSIKKVPLKRAWIENETGATVHCRYDNKAQEFSEIQNFTLIIDGIGGRAVDLDGMIKPIMTKAGKTADPKSMSLSMGNTSADCRYDSATDSKGVLVSYIACHYEAYVIKFLALGFSDKKAKSTLKKIMKKQDDFVATRELCAAHIEDIKNMKPSGATSRPLLATSVEYEQKGATCFFTATLSPGVKGGFNQVVYTFPENPDTPLMMTLHRDDGRLIKTFRLQHAFAREADRDDKQAIYNLVKTDPDGTHTIYDTAYTRVLPIPRFFSESIKADTGKIKEKLGLKRNADGGFNMMMK